MAKSYPPASDEELFAAEQTQRARGQAAIERIEDEKEQTRLATSGEPEAKEALRAMASVLDSTSASEPAPPEKKPRRKRAVTHNGNGDAPPESIDERGAKAYKLMDAAFRKWKAGSRKNYREACRELARDLGGDGAVYMQAGIIRLGDLLDAMNKLTVSGKVEREEAGADDYEKEMEAMREALRKTPTRVEIVDDNE